MNVAELALHEGEMMMCNLQRSGDPVLDALRMDYRKCYEGISGDEIMAAMYPDFPNISEAEPVILRTGSVAVLISDLVREGGARYLYG